jgi:hypothetical protein
MELKDRIVRLDALLNEHPKIVLEAKIAPLAAKLVKEIDALLEKSEASVHKNTAEYSDLISLLSNKETKALITVKWLNDHAANGKRWAKIGKKEIEEFILDAVKARLAGALIKEIKETPRRQMEKELDAIAHSDDAEVRVKLKAMKPTLLLQFCELNDIPVVRKATGAFDKIKTQSNILKKIEEVREYTKLVKV